MTRAQFDYEVGIEWVLNDVLAFDYVRESSSTTRTLDGPPPNHNGDILVGWALLHRDTPTQNDKSRVYFRRYFWLKDSDRPFSPDGAFSENYPAEAVDPRTVITGRPGRKPRAMMWE